MYGRDVFFKIDFRILILNKTTRFVYTKKRYAIDECDECFLFIMSMDARVRKRMLTTFEWRGLYWKCVLYLKFHKGLPLNGADFSL